ncbi:HypC/HybG/HupF family hydrogenase formation chaperone, partial [Candidatus Micrarchaeota archaeon]|nr:HypC/HybG/HupF family hydrogenase formation chaperone [Candidatus Micrarchaeota archaeon]
MCYSIPGKVTGLNGRVASIDYYGEEREAIVDIPSVKEGDFVFAQGGLVIKKISKDEAERILRVWRRKFFELKKRDLKLSREDEIGDIGWERILKKAGEGSGISKKEMLFLMGLEGEEKLNALYKTANAVRRKKLKNSCCVHGIIEFSSYCGKDCLYCGINARNDRLQRYRMDEKEIVETADYAVNELGFKALVLQSGEDAFYTTKKIIKVITEIKKQCDVLLFLS